MREIMSALCRAWKPEWQGLVMAELCYKEGQGAGSADYEITISERRLVRVAASAKDTGEAMSMVLLPLRKGEALATAETECRRKSWRTFSAEEVRAFSSALGDHNEIHQGAHPIVSGFQILRALRGAISYPAVRIRFHQPLYAGEKVSLVEEAGTLKGYAGALCFTCEEIK